MSDTYRSGGKVHSKRTGKMKLQGKAAADAAIQRGKEQRQKPKLKPPEKGGEPKRIK